MRYVVLATDYDGTLAGQGQVCAATMEKLRQLQATGRRLILVTGREMKALVAIFPAYRIFDFIVAENGALIHKTANGEEHLLGPAPDPSFVRLLEEKGVRPLSIGKVIIATWVPQEQAVLDAIKSSGVERQVIFNKGAVMILPPGINKGIGLQTLLRALHLSLHNTVAVGDAENDTAMLQMAECAVAVSNALPAVKSIADWVTAAGHGDGVMELMDQLIVNDLAVIGETLNRHDLELGTLKEGGPFVISPYRSGILVAGVTGSGKTTFTLSIVESLARQAYQFCLVDPEGDYLQLPDAIVLGNEVSLPSIEEIKKLLMDPGQNLVICTLSIPLADRPAFFARLLQAVLDLRREYARPHWLLLDEAHHLVPEDAGMPEDPLPGDLNNFILISTSPHALCAKVLSKVGMIITMGQNPIYPVEQFCKVVGQAMPEKIPALAEDEIGIWERDRDKPPYVAKFNLPNQLQKRHKKKYAQGDMGGNSFIFTGRENKLKLKAGNLLMFVLMAEGIDEDTWLFHLRRKDYTRWFMHSVHDEELAREGEEAEKLEDPAASKKMILRFITDKYTS